ncbi:MAG TPA: FAD-binding oxidoreductase, partial [Kiloniellaceae bacterium]|nr:FAD-binding oxidoreductase [Kiloniellaceae bacterium]
MTAADYIDSYYGRTRRRRPPFAPLEGRQAAEVCVIGGGLAGLNTALGLAQRGKRVVLLEARRIGWGASGRNGGFVGAGYALNPERLEAKVGRAAAVVLHGLTLSALALMKSRIRYFAIDCSPVDGVVVANW